MQLACIRGTHILMMFALMGTVVDWALQNQISTYPSSDDEQNIVCTAADRRITATSFIFLGIAFPMSGWFYFQKADDSETE